MTLVLLVTVALILIVALLKRHRAHDRGGVELSSAPLVRQRSAVRVLRTEDEIRAVVIQVRDRERNIAQAAERRAARLNALVRPSARPARVPDGLPSMAQASTRELLPPT